MSNRNQLGKGGNFVRGLLNFITFGLIPGLHYQGGETWHDGLDNLLDSVAKKYGGTGLTNAEIEANEFTHNENELAYQRQREFYQDFQSPQAMVNQYREAGLNPALMYQSGGSSSGVIGSSGAQSVSPTGGDLGQFISLMAGLAFRAKEVRAETQLKGAQSKLINSQRIGQENENSAFAERFDFWKRIQSKTLENIDADTFLKHADASLKSQGINESEARTTLLHYQGLTARVESAHAEENWLDLHGLRQSAMRLNDANRQYALSQSDESKQRLYEAQQSWGSRWRTIQENLVSLEIKNGLSENEAKAFWTDKRLNELLVMSEIYHNYKLDVKVGPFGTQQTDWLNRDSSIYGPSMYAPLYD